MNWYYDKGDQGKGNSGKPGTTIRPNENGPSQNANTTANSKLSSIFKNWKPTGRVEKDEI